MGNPKKALRFLLISALAAAAALCILFWPYAGAFLSILFGWAPLAAPFCLLQLTLCRRCPYQIFRAAPVTLSGTGFLYGLFYTVNSYEWAALFGLVIMVPSMIILAGSGVGWLLWRLTEHKAL